MSDQHKRPVDEHGSKRSAAAAIKVSLTSSREEEYRVIQEMRDLGVNCAAVDYGGEFISSFMKIVERCIVAAKREGLINDSHLEEGAVAGAAREALSNIMSKAIGLNIGGKLAIARYKDNVSVAVFFGVGLLHLDEVAVGLGHRVV